MNRMLYESAQRRILVDEIQDTYECEIRQSIEDTKVLSENYVPCICGTKDTEIIFELKDSVSAVLKYAETGSSKTAVLNFANFTRPGGGFITGAMAQEEALCLESTLYPVISDDKFVPFYQENQQIVPIVGSLYCNRALYSPDIVFFRDKEEVSCDVITCAAPNASEYLSAGGSQKINGNALLDRLSFILSLAAKEGVGTLILGAYGTGVFGQNPTTFGGLYEYVFRKCFPGVFDRIVIAVIDEKTLQRIKDGYEMQ